MFRFYGEKRARVRHLAAALLQHVAVRHTSARKANQFGERQHQRWISLLGAHAGFAIGWCQASASRHRARRRRRAGVLRQRRQGPRVPVLAALQIRGARWSAASPRCDDPVNDDARPRCAADLGETGAQHGTRGVSAPRSTSTTARVADQPTPLDDAAGCSDTDADLAAASPSPSGTRSIARRDRV